jgi:hypothetical protein
MTHIQESSMYETFNPSILPEGINNVCFCRRYHIASEMTPIKKHFMYDLFITIFPTKLLLTNFVQQS